MRSVFSKVRRVAVVSGATLATTIAFGTPFAQAADVTVGPFPPTVQCVTSQGTDIVCLQGSARVQLTEPAPINDNTLSATLILDVYCTGSIGCTPLHEEVPVPRTGAERGSPTVGSAVLITVPNDMLCVGEEGDQDCIPGFDIPVTGPTVSGTLATVWIFGTAYPITVPTDVPTPDAGELVGLVVGVANNVLNRVGVEIHIES